MMIFLVNAGLLQRGAAMRIATKAGGPFNALARQFTIEFKVSSEGASALKKPCGGAARMFAMACG